MVHKPCSKRARFGGPFSHPALCAQVAKRGKKALLRLQEGLFAVLYAVEGSLQAFRLEAAQEGFLMMRVLQRDVLRHFALAYGVEQRLVHGLHAGGAV